MWPFKKKAIKPIGGAVWGHLHSEYKIDVDTLSKEMRCVEREQVIEGSGPVTFLRVFKPRETEQRGIEVTGWETFDEHPYLVHFEGYIGKKQTKYLWSGKAPRVCYTICLAAGLEHGT